MTQKHGKRANAFAAATDMLGPGLDALFNSSTPELLTVALDLIVVKEQVRITMETEDNTIAELAASIKARGVLQPILVRPLGTGYELVAGERRYRASRIAGLNSIPAYVRHLTDEEAVEAQFAENIHRLNLSQLEEARKIQKDLDALGGDVDALLARVHKSRGWLSKMTALLTLSPEAARVITGNVSADLEVILGVNTVAHVDPARAAELVDTLAEGRGQINARETVIAAKREVKPRKQKDAQSADGASVATPRDHSQEEPGTVAVFAGAKQADTPDVAGADPVGADVAALMRRLYVDIVESKTAPRVAFDMLSTKGERDSVIAWLQTAYDTGRTAKDSVKAVMAGLQSGVFATAGDGAFGLAAFLAGATGARFSAFAILGAVAQ